MALFLCIGEDGTFKKNPDAQSEAGVAMAKIKSVYGKVAPLDELLRDTEITRSLGTVKKIRHHFPKEFRALINSYIDSANKKKGCAPLRSLFLSFWISPFPPSYFSLSQREYWPIIRKVRLKGKFPVLSSGAILVDLPGVRDANAARGKIAANYLKNSHTIWIVANITRAVDDKTAKDMLGENFRRQVRESLFSRCFFAISSQPTDLCSAAHDGWPVRLCCLYLHENGRDQHQRDHAVA